MSNSPHSTIAAMVPVRSRFKAEQGLLGRWLEKLLWRRQRGRLIQTLRGFNDSLLADIGITRGEIPQAVDGVLNEGREARFARIQSVALAQSEGRPKLVA